MFRRLVILWMVLHLVVFNGVLTGAEGISESETMDIQKENQQINGTVEQKQTIDIGEESNDIFQNQELTVDQNQLIVRSKRERG